MNEFADAFRNARLKSGKTYRQIKDKVGLSIGFWSELENGKRNPPEISVIEQIEKFFEVTDGHLIKLAKRARVKSPTNIGHLIKTNPKLQEVLYRADALPPEKLEIFLEELRKNSEDGDENPFYLNWNSIIYFDREVHP